MAARPDGSKLLTLSGNLTKRRVQKKRNTRKLQSHVPNLEPIAKSKGNVLVLRRTEDFWIDLGIVSLWRHSASVIPDRSPANGSIVASNKSLTLTLSDKLLVVAGKSQRIVEQFLVGQLQRLRADSWVKTRKGKWWWSPFANFFFAQQTDPNRFLLTPRQLVERQRGKWRTGTCDFCGSSDLSTKPVGTSENPFMVVPERMSNFYSNLRGEMRICENCVLASRFSPDGLFYTIEDQRMLGFCFESTSLVALDRAYPLLSRLMAEKERYRNFKITKGSVPPQYPMETFASFLVEVEQEIGNQEGAREELDQLNLVHIFSMERSGKTTSLERYYALPNLPALFDLAHGCEWVSSQGKKFNALAETLRPMFFIQGNRKNTVLREAFCSDLLRMRTVSYVIEDFIYQSMNEGKVLGGFYNINIHKLVETYLVGFLGMDSNVIRLTRTLGETIGDFAHESENKSILYSLRSCRNHEDLLAFFEQLLVRYTDQARRYGDVRSLLSEISKSNWREYKSLIAIFAALRYSETKTRPSMRGVDT